MESKSEAEQFIQIYLFDPTGEFYWCNGSTDVDIENQGVLHAGLFATLFNYSRETLGEKLNYLLINELRINLFSLVDKYLVAIVTPKFIKVDPRKIKIIKTKVIQALNNSNPLTENEIIELITHNLNTLLTELLDWLQIYVVQANLAMNVLTERINDIEERQVGVFLYTWDSNRVFKYLPGSNTIDYQIEELIDNSITDVDFLSNLDRTFIIQNNTVIYFLVDDLILVLTKSYDSGELDTTVDAINKSSEYFEKVLKKVTNLELWDADLGGM